MRLLPARVRLGEPGRWHKRKAAPRKRPLLLPARSGKGDIRPHGTSHGSWGHHPGATGSAGGASPRRASPRCIPAPSLGGRPAPPRRLPRRAQVTGRRRGAEPPRQQPSEQRSLPCRLVPPFLPLIVFSSFASRAGGAVAAEGSALLSALRSWRLPRCGCVWISPREDSCRRFQKNPQSQVNHPLG